MRAVPLGFFSSSFQRRTLHFGNKAIYFLSEKTQQRKLMKKKKKDLQKNRIFNRLLNVGSITTEFAINRKWLTKLSTRVGEIERDLGIKIHRERVKWGGTHGTRYWLYDNQRDDLKNMIQIQGFEEVSWL